MPILQIEYVFPDIDSWKKVFDVYDVRRRDSGVLRYRILCPLGDPSHALIDLEFDSVPEAEDFLSGLRKTWARSEGAFLQSPRARIAREVISRDLGHDSQWAKTSGNVRIVQNIYEGFGRRDFGIIVRYFDPEIQLHQTPVLPWGGDYHGYEGAAAFFKKLLANIESRVEIGALVDAGEHVVATGRTRGRSKQTGEAFDVAEVHVWRLKNGKVVDFLGYADTPARTAALEPSRMEHGALQ